MNNSIKYNYDQAKAAGIEISPTTEIVNLGFKGIRINDMALPDYIIYEVSNFIEALPHYIELLIPNSSKVLN